MDNQPSDIQRKYQKLASEYSKMRAQLSVLKKAVIDEQQKSCTYETQLKEKDQSNRKYEQEMESLSFRNEQLTKRVMILQDEFEDLGRSNKKNKKKSLENVSSNSSSGSSVINEELQHKIEENAELHKKVYEIEVKYQDQLQDFQTDIDRLRRDATSYESTLANSEEKNKFMIEKLTKDKARLELKLQSEEKTLREKELQADNYLDNLNSIHGDLSSKLSSTTKIIEDKLLFNDTKSRGLNSLNIPTVDFKQQKVVQRLVLSVGDYFKDFVGAISNLHTYNEQRIKIFYGGQTLSPINAKLVEYLHGNASKLRPMNEAFTEFSSSLTENAIISFETIPSFTGLFNKLSDYVSYWNTLLPYHLLSIQEECALSSCSSSLESKNIELYSSFLNLSGTFDQVITYLRFISLQSESTNKIKYAEQSQSKILLLLSSALSSLHFAFKDILKHFNVKISLENELPTVSEELKRTNECILSSLISIANCLGKIANLLDESIPIIGQGMYYKTRGNSISVPGSNNFCSSPAVLDFQKRATTYMALVDEEEPDSVPYEEALRNREVLHSSSESRESLAKQVETLMDKVHKLEQAKEHWMLEFQLLEIKHERDLKKLAELEINNGTRTETDAIVETRSHRSSSAAVPLTVLGDVERIMNASNELDAREEKMKQYFASRINDMVAEMQLADSKVITFQTECLSLQKRLHLNNEAKLQLQADLLNEKNEIVQLKEELQLTKKNYDGQLNTMSEHLANLNETLTVQKDEIDELKHSLKLKGQKKGKLI